MTYNNDRTKLHDQGTEAKRPGILGWSKHSSTMLYLNMHLHVTGLCNISQNIRRTPTCAVLLLAHYTCLLLYRLWCWLFSEQGSKALSSDYGIAELLVIDAAVVR